jgi:hypothetical protein
MGKTLLDLYPEESGPRPDREPPFAYMERRAGAWARLSTRPGYDLVILGAGLVGASAALAGALNGIRVALLQVGAYPQPMTSSWTDETGSISAQPLIRSAQLLSRLKDATCKLETTAPLVFAPAESLKLKGIRGILAACVGPGRISRVPRIAALIRALLFTARQEGAVCLNHVCPVFVESEPVTGGMSVGVRNESNGDEADMRCGAILVDPDFGVLPGSRLSKRPVWCASPEGQRTSASPDIIKRGGCFIPQGWAPWEYEMCVSRVLSEIRKEGGMREEYVPSGAWPLPLLSHDTSGESSFRGHALEASIPNEVVASVLQRWGAFCRYISAYPDGLDVLPKGIVKGELFLARDVFQAVTGNDLLNALQLPHGSALPDEALEIWKQVGDVASC